MRFEIKFTYAPSQDDGVESWLRLHPAGFRVAYPERRVHNVYFDTFELEAFQENLAGISRRSKVRYRWYGDSDTPVDGTLEFKNKRASLGWKDSHPITGLCFDADESWQRFRRRLRDRLPPEARIVFDEHPLPALINSYRRRYFVSRDGAIRITLDSEQRMFDQTRHGRPNVTRPINLPDVHVLELKCDAAFKREASRVLDTCPARGSRFSKYTTGIALR